MIIAYDARAHLATPSLEESPSHLQWHETVFSVSRDRHETVSPNDAKSGLGPTLVLILAEPQALILRNSGTHFSPSARLGALKIQNARSYLDTVGAKAVGLYDSRGSTSYQIVAFECLSLAISQSRVVA